MEKAFLLSRELLLSFIPIFVAIDAIGLLPILLSLTQDMKPQERRRMIRLAMITALGLGLGFLAIGKGVFLALGIKVADFLVAGGAILFLLAAKDLVTGKFMEAQASLGEVVVGVVPIGTPLVVGPAVLTTLLLLIDQYSRPIVLVAFGLNLALTWLFFAQANRIARALGQAGLKAVSKIAMLLLAAIAVKMIRQGILTMV